ncbi:Glycoside hydrolase superfamily,Glycosyl hydrolase, family 13, catalytic domain [Cinara cedri]|uniref:alpha-glucosidase n=1 Tax=Cinara cedri TaxID=506608 RepID=A0A5E4NGD8_9HEMI|nr:Glycoside hydrolase superfamily,Glycosyl hydrolase, family 13, catalytic domain [Cinara cedri]
MYWNICWLLTCVICLTSCDVVVPPTTSLNSDWWQHSVIYEIYPLSFKDSNGDGFGDFRGIIEKLDYIAKLGVTAIWLTPFMESPLRTDGYDISDYLKIESIFGTMDDFKDLLDKAHGKNLKVIMDFIPNHTSDKHIWFESSREQKSNKYIDYYIWRNAKNHDDIMQNSSIIPEEPNNWRIIYGNGDDNSSWIWDDMRNQFYFTQFDQNLPDLNLRHTSVLKELKSVLEYWLNLGIDGIRIDALRYLFEDIEMDNEPLIDVLKSVSYDNLNHIYTVDQYEVYDLLTEWRKILDDIKKKDNKTRIIMTDSHSNNSVLFEYYNCGIEIPTNFNLMDLVKIPGYTVDEWDLEIRKFITEMPKGGTFNVILQTHDQPRISSDFIDGMNALSLFLPGVAIVYYGGEIGMQNTQYEGVHFAKSPMQWDDTQNAGFSTHSTWIPVHSNYETINVKKESIDPKSYLSFFKSITALRQTETFKRGGLATYNFNNTVYVLIRFLPGNYSNYTLIINMDSELQQICLSDQIPDLDNNLTVYSGSGNSNFNAGNIISANQLIILSPGATVILTENTATTHSPSTSRIQTRLSPTSSWTLTSPSQDSTIPSSAIQLCISFLVLLLCLVISKICNV